MNYRRKSLNEATLEPELRIKLARLSAERCINDSLPDDRIHETLDKYDPADIIDVIIDDGLIGYLWSSLHKSCLFPQQLQEEFDKYRLDALRRELLIRQQIPELWQLFNEMGIEPILFRGLSYSEMYPPSVFRDLSDIDILIQEKRFTELTDTLKNNGWQSYFSYPDLFWKDGVSIDLHTEMMGGGRKSGRSYAGDISVQDLFSRSEVMQIEGMPVRVLDPIDDLICALVHWLKHSFSRFCWGVDIFMLCDKISNNNLWNEAEERILCCNARKLVIFGLIPAERIFGVSLPESLSAIINSTSTSRLSGKLLDAVSRGQYAEYSGYILFADTIKSHFRKWKFIFNVLYPDRQARKRMNESIYSGSRNWMFPILRIKRGLKGVSDLVRILH
ncbi:MAG: nucleotidyltransferase family protein [Calditrichaeota bacterium]|nr:nucleotidyltransferase family protein [Calditrichota bacterium]